MLIRLRFRVGKVCQAQMRWQVEVIAHVSFSMAQAWHVRCEHDGAVAGSLRASNHRRRKLQVLIEVELEPEGAAGCLRDVLNAACREGAGGHQGMGHTGSPGGGAFAFRMREAM